MTDTATFVAAAERELRKSRTISVPVCQAWRSLPPDSEAAFAPAMAFLGCAAGSVPPVTTKEADRVAADRLMLLKLHLDGGDPRWSSQVLERLVAAAATISGESPTDLFRALYSVLGEFAVELTPPVAAFTKELVIRCFTRFRPTYEGADWPNFLRATAGPLTAAQCYLLLTALPARYVSRKLADVIVRELESTPYRDEAVAGIPS